MVSNGSNNSSNKSNRNTLIFMHRHNNVNKEKNKETTKKEGTIINKIFLKDATCFEDFFL